MDLDFVWVHKHADKELGQYPAILTSHLVNNPYIYNGYFWEFFLKNINEKNLFKKMSVRAMQEL